MLHLSDKLSWNLTKHVKTSTMSKVGIPDPSSHCILNSITIIYLSSKHNEIKPNHTISQSQKQE